MNAIRERLAVAPSSTWVELHDAAAYLGLTASGLRSSIARGCIAAMLVEGIVEISGEDVLERLRRRRGVALKRLGWTRVQRGSGARKRWVYVAPFEDLAA